jgi:ribosome-associated translation inhibitor RaiA
MDIRLFDGSIKTSDAELGYILDRIGGAIDRIADAAGHVDVRLVDVNGPRGGLDKSCAILLTRAHRPALRIEERAETYYEAIDAAASRLRRALARSLDRPFRRGRDQRGMNARMSNHLSEELAS